MNPIIEETSLLKPHVTDDISYRCNIIILKTSPLTVNTTQHLISTSEALAKLGHTVTVVANNLTLECKKALQHDCEQIHTVGRFIPQTIFGRFSGILRFIRTLYTTLYVSIIHKCNYMEPTMIISYNADISIPLLNIFGNFPIVYFYHLPNAHKKKNGNITLSFYEKICVQFAGKIIVASEQIKSLLCEEYPHIFARSHILYHTVDTKQYRRCAAVHHRELFSGMTVDSKIFLAIGPFTPGSHYELVINSFLQLMRDLKQAGDAVYKDAYLVIATSSQSENEASFSYMWQLHQLLADAGDEARRVVEVRGMQLEVEKSLMSQCVALLMPGRSDLRQLRLLRAMHAKVPVIAVKSCYALELLVDGVTGVLIPDCPETLTNYMRLLLLDQDVVRVLSMSTQRFYNQHFNFSSYQMKLQRIIMQ